MVNVKRSRVIRGDPQKIWELISRVERYPEWMPGVIEAQLEGQPKSAKTGLGRRQILRTDMEIGQAETLQEVIAWEPPNKITWQHLRDVIDGKEVKYAREIKTTLSVTINNGEVTFRMVGSWQPVGISGQLMNRLMKRMVTRNFEKALDNLEKLITRKSPKIKKPG